MTTGVRRALGLGSTAGAVATGRCPWWLGLLLVLGIGFGVPSGAQAGTPPEADSPELAQAGDYQRHMDNGVKLFHDGNYRAAIAEFEAAYQAEPKAHPLVNMAHCYKALFDYPRAIEALDKTIKKHADSLAPEHLDAAKREITELRGLLAYVSVTVDPQKATLLVDEVEVPRSKRGKPIPLSPGPHVIAARLDGYKTAERKLTLVSGEHRKNVALELKPSGGLVRVFPHEFDSWVQIDGQAPHQGPWEGRLPPGVHEIRVFKHGEPESRVQVVVAAGGRHVVRQDEDGELSSESAAPVAADEPDPDAEADRTGIYLLAHGVLLAALTHPQKFSRTERGGGGGLGARVGYRVADWAALEGFGQLTDIRADGNATVGDYVYADSTWALQSLRLGAGLRFLAPAEGWIRFTGLLGGGLVLEQISWSTGSIEPAVASAVGTVPTRSNPYDDAGGVGAYVHINAGVELEFSNVLVDLLMEMSIQSTRGLDPDTDPQTFDGRGLVLLGSSLHLGYAFW